MDPYIEKLRKNLFRSEKQEDWTDKDAWIRRATFWKLVAMALESTTRCTDPVLANMYESALGADLSHSPPVSAVKAVASVAVKRFNERDKSKIVIAKP